MTINETLTIVAYMLAPAFFSLLAMASLGSSVVAVLGEMAAKTKGKVFYDKYGQQTAAMGFVLLILFLVVEAAAVGVAYVKFPQYIDKFLAPGSPLIYALISLGAFVLFGLPYFLTWKKMRDSKGLHMALGLVAAMAAIAMIAIAVPAKLMIGATPETGNIQPMILPMAVMYAILTVSFGAGASCCYLVLRRNKDDFGRDYYNFSLKLAARWAAIPMTGFLACQGWLFAVLPETFRTMTVGTPLGIVWCVGAGLGLACAVIWTLIARSQAPLQLKGLTFLAAAFLWIMHVMNATVFVNFMSMF